ncbi:hypothetical protein TIFTF001_029348 [Ficus carica]|uniref:Uncharacterized protein n=1 Tax=Ficus carica TaxID=3494 RepID=A0AA88DRL5_FICCA|nr:hypothetical protein TIFTF001_029348 [Ficus carica]
MLLGGEEANHLRFFLPSSHPPLNLSSTLAPTIGHPPYSPSINVQKSLLKQHIGAQDVRVVPSVVAAFDAAVVFIVAAVPTFGENTENIDDSRDDEGDEVDVELLEGDVILCSAADSDERNDELRSSHISLDPATISRSFLTSSTHEQMIRASTPVIGAFTLRDWQTHGLIPTFLTPVCPQTHGTMATASTPSLESLMHYTDRRIGEHLTYMKSMLANHEAAIVQKMEANNKTIVHKIESAMAMNKEACSGELNVEFEQ